MNNVRERHTDTKAGKDTRDTRQPPRVCHTLAHSLTRGFEPTLLSLR